LKKSDALAQIMSRRLQLRVPDDADLAWRARRALERLLGAWPAAFLARVADADGLCLAIHQGQTGLATAAADQAGDCRVTLSFGLEQLLDAADVARAATGALAMSLLANCGGPRAAMVRAEFERRLAAASGLDYASAGDEGRAESSYLAWACAAYLADRAALAGQDPQAYRLLRSTLFSEDFWRSLAGAPYDAADRG
jgi:hypothetical protein